MDATDHPHAEATDVGIASRCYEKGCSSREVAPCLFADRHGRRCISTWCSEHRFSDEGVTYCRRHASIVRALGHAGNDTGMPELENRAPSLVNWVANGVDRRVQALLEERATMRPGRELAVEPVHLVVGTRGRRWSRSWSLRNPAGHDALRVSIEVDEHSDPEIAVRIDGDVVTRSIAPWIGHRLRGEWVPPDTEAVERTQFYDDLVTVITEAIDEATDAEAQRDGGGSAIR